MCILHYVSIGCQPSSAREKVKQLEIQISMTIFRFVLGQVSHWMQIAQADRYLAPVGVFHRRWNTYRSRWPYFCYLSELLVAGCWPDRDNTSCPWARACPRSRWDRFPLPPRPPALLSQPPSPSLAASCELRASADFAELHVADLRFSTYYRTQLLLRLV